MKIYSLILVIVAININAQHIGEFTSVLPASQNTDFIIPSSHSFQTIITQDDPLTQGGTLPRNTDFTGYVPILGSSENGHLSINAENVPGAVSILDINYNSITKLWSTSYSQAVDFSSVVFTMANCSGTVTPWNTIISCEEYTSKEYEGTFPLDANDDGYHDIGWAVEIDPATKTVIDKRWALGNFKHENLVIHSNERTAYQGADADPGYLYKFVADNAQDLSSGHLYVYKGLKNGPGNWILLNNSTKEERNTTVSQSFNVGATAFRGIEDVEIGPDGFIYFAVKSEDRVYRFEDSDPLTGTVVLNMETYVGNSTYTIMHENGTTNANWGYGNDNLAFDNEGNLWVLNDGDNNYIWVVKNGHTQANPKVEVFGIAPLGAEPTGITFSPDYRFLFMSIMHPDAGNNATTQIDAAGAAIAFNKATTVVIALNENLGTTEEISWYLDFDGDGYAVAPTITSTTSPGPNYTSEVLPLTDCNDNDASVFEVSTWYLDADGDGYSTGQSIQSCNTPGNGYVQNITSTSDCDDTDASVFETSTWYADADGDGYTTSETMESCGSPGPGYSDSPSNTLDCDDNDPTVFEVSTWYLDVDGDGHSTGQSIQSCNTPGNGYVQNIISISDCDDTDASLFETSSWYADVDGDGYTISESIESCGSPGPGYSDSPSNTLDCDDNDPTVFEVSTWYLDADGDGHSTGQSVQSCNNPGNGYVQNIISTSDCDDTDASVFETSSWYADADGDGYTISESIESCGSPGPGYTDSPSNTLDCDDNDPTVFEISTWYLDADGDGHSTGQSIQSCNNPGNGYIQNITSTSDCDDTDASVFETFTWYADADGDGYTISESIESCGSPGPGYLNAMSIYIDCDDTDKELYTETIWRLDANEDGTADNNESLISCRSPGFGYTNNNLSPFVLMDEIVLFPNPTTEIAVIRFGKTIPSARLTLVNSSKQLVFSKTINNQSEVHINLSTMASGIYYVTIHSAEETFIVHKIIKK